MFGSASPRYVALHLRLGGLPGEVEFKEARGGSTPFHNMMKAVSCANRMAKHKGIDQPVMVVTDNHELRSFLRVRCPRSPSSCVPAVAPVAWLLRTGSRAGHRRAPRRQSHACGGRRGGVDHQLFSHARQQRWPPATMPRSHLQPSPPIRARPQEKNLVNVITPDLEPVHIDLAAKNSASDHKTSVVDLILLGRATCLVTSPSGFSHQAWLAGGGKPCQREFMNCTSLEAGASGGSGHLGK